MPPLDAIGKGLTDALQDPPVWVALITAVGAVLTTVGARKAGESLRSWAKRYDGPRPTKREGEILVLLRDIRDATRDTERAIKSEADTTRELIRSEGRMTRTAVHQEASSTKTQLQSASESLAVLRERHRGDR